MGDFESVSPIYFNSADELKKKLGLLKQKQRKGKKEEPWDTSQANRSFTGGDRGILRGEFEHGRCNTVSCTLLAAFIILINNLLDFRVLYRLLRGAIKPALYSIPDVSWCANLRLLAFTCNLRAVDLRPYEERQQSPRPLDYGWAEANVLDPNLSLKPGSAVHLVRAEDRLLGTGRPNVVSTLVDRKKFETNGLSFFLLGLRARKDTNRKSRTNSLVGTTALFCIPGRRHHRPDCFACL